MAILRQGPQSSVISTDRSVDEYSEVQRGSLSHRVCGDRPSIQFNQTADPLPFTLVSETF